MKKENNFRYLLFLLLVPVIVLVYLFKKKNAKQDNYFRVEEVSDEQAENLEPQQTFASNGLNDRQMKILDYVSKNEVGKVSDMVKIFSQTDRTLRRDLNKLEGMGFVKRSGSTKSVSYTLA